MKPSKQTKDNKSLLLHWSHLSLNYISKIGTENVSCIRAGDSFSTNLTQPANSIKKMKTKMAAGLLVVHYVVASLYKVNTGLIFK